MKTTSKQLPPINLIDPGEFGPAADWLRSFFKQKGFVEAPVQHRLSILAACEDPSTIATFNYIGSVWPLPQTGQMWLEYELLTKPENPGYYCISYSYRAEPNPVPGRHDLIFPMFEFETHGGIKKLIELEKELIEFLGLADQDSMPQLRYQEAADRCQAKEIDSKQEQRLGEELGPVVFLTHFPYRTSPFWNMKKTGEVANKVDVLLFGIETIGSAERSTNPSEMHEQFHTISNGQYAELLYSRFGQERVEKELKAFLDLDFFPRCGGGIGMTRLIRALKLAGRL